MDDEIFKEMYKLETYHWWFVARRRILHKVISRLGLSNDANILDAGCGNGDNLNLLSCFGNVTAFEKDTDAVERAKSRKIGRVFEGHLPDSIPDEVENNFDLIVLLDVLEHIEDDAKSLDKIKSLLSKKGKILITVPAYQWLWTNHDTLHHHKRRYTYSSVKKILNMTNFKIKYISYFNTLLFPLAVLERVKQKLLPPKENEILTIPNDILNLCLGKIFGMEEHLINRFVLPYGLSILAVAEAINTNE